MKYDYLLMTSKTYYQYHARNYMYSMHGIRQESAVKHIGMALHMDMAWNQQSNI